MASDDVRDQKCSAHHLGLPSAVPLAMARSAAHHGIADSRPLVAHDVAIGQFYRTTCKLAKERFLVVCCLTEVEHKGSQLIFLEQTTNNSRRANKPEARGRSTLTGIGAAFPRRVRLITLP